jgi:rhodanese-related sulfurtransferase
MPTKGIPMRCMCALFLVTSLLLAACGGKAAPTAVPAPTATTPISPTTAPTKAPTTGTGVNIAQGTLMENEKTPEVSTAELQQILATKSATVFDARPFNEFAISHIPGALNVAAKPGVPPSQYVSDVAEIGRLVPGKEMPIVLYCNGPYCGKSKRLSEELLQAGYTNVRRYQLGIPTWRALVGLTQIEIEGVRYVQGGDKTSVFFDARSPEEFKAGTLPGARNLLAADVVKAKDDGRLPVEDHNTRIIVFGKDGEQARAVADAIAKNAFHNVAFYAGSLDSLK